MTDIISQAKRKYTLQRDRLDLRDKMYHSPDFRTPEHLPASVDLRAQCSPIVDQGQLGSCTANAIASGLREYLLLQSGQELTRLSRLFLYWHEREIEHTVNEDSGAMIRDGMKVLQKLGVCPEVDYPYEISHFTDRPSPQAEQDALTNRISEYHRVTNLNLLKAALASGLPVVLGFSVYESFESAETAKTGIVTIPDPSMEQLLGGHAVLAVGYDDAKQQVIVRNSWGTTWGDQGYCYFPYELFQDGIVNDMWTGKV
ncbi:MAG: C1 family peptidase [Tumebacillaceae bacterium]